MHRSTRRSTMVVALSVCVTLTAAAACSGGDDDDTADSVSAEATATAASDTDAESSTDSAAPGSTEPGTTSGGHDEPAATDARHRRGARAAGLARTTSSDEGEPVKGGTLVFGLEADTANAWAPYRASYATSGLHPDHGDLRLAVHGDRRRARPCPLLVESVDTTPTTPSGRCTSARASSSTTARRSTARPSSSTSTPTAPRRSRRGALTPIDTVTASGQDVVITIKGGPWVALPSYLTYGSIGYMLSPTWLASLPDVPQRTEGGPVYDAAVAATPADGDPAKPVGLGAFVFESYTPGNGNTFRAVRNDDYWRGPNGITGEDLPYLDAIEAVVAVDIDSRQSAAALGRVRRHAHGQLRHHQPAPRRRRPGGLVDEPLRRHVVLRDQRRRRARADPEGKNAANPLLNVHCRRALAHAMDRQRMTEERGAGLVLPANGPFPPGSIGYLEDNGYPEFDVDLAHEEMDQCLVRARHRPHRVPLRHDERPVQRRDRRARAVDVGRRVRRPGPGRRSPRSSRASTSASPSPGTSTCCRAAATAASTRPAAAVVAEGVGQPGRRARPQLRPHLRRRHRRGAADDQVEPRPGGPQGGCRGDQPALRRAGLPLVVELDAVGRRHPAVRQRRREQRRCRTAPRASGWRSPAATRSTRSGATTALRVSGSRPPERSAVGLPDTVRG